MAANDLVMPKLGLTMTEGVLSEWLVAPGDTVSAGQILFVVETDKLATEIEATGDGEIVELIAEAGATLPVGAVVARWTGAGPGGSESAAAAPSAPVEVTAPAEMASRDPGDARRVVATPLARRAARVAGVDLQSVKGSGAGGRIKAADVAAAGQARPEPVAIPAATGAMTRQQGTREEVTRQAATPLQATVARRLSAAKRDIPHFYLAGEADVGALMTLRAQLNADGGRGKLSVNHFIMLAVARSWADRPEANRIWEDDGFSAFPTVDLGFAIDTPRGLFAPVLRDVASMDIDTLAAAADATARRAREGRLTGDELAGGAVSVSNVGMHRVTYLTPIVNPGQSAILGVGTIRPAFRPDEKQQPVLKQELGLVLACDHRVFNGVMAAELLGSIVTYLEAPLKLLRAAQQKG